jgi:hypothetical protein
MSRSLLAMLDVEAPSSVKNRKILDHIEGLRIFVVAFHCGPRRGFDNP